MVQINEISGLFASFGASARAAMPKEPPAPGFFRIDLRRSAGLHVLTPAHPLEDAPKFAYVIAGLEAPRRDDAYIVELPADFDEATSTPSICDVRVLAYIDRFGRVFTQDAPSSVPPARRPDLLFESFEKGARYGGPAGNVTVFDEDGSEIHPAQYRREGRFVAFCESLYDFGFATTNVTMDEALSRAYLAFVYAPRKEGRSLKVFDIESVRKLLHEKPLVTALREIRREVDAATGKHAKSSAAGGGAAGGAKGANLSVGGLVSQMLQPPVLVQCLSRWLSEAGLSQALAMTAHSYDVQLRLVQGTAYSTTYYVAREEGSVVPERLVWKLEGALNRFRLLEEQLGPLASVADESVCSQRDIENVVNIGLQAPLADQPINGPEAYREWDVRRSIGEALERFRLPLRFEASYRVDVAGNAAAFEMIVPSADMMPEFVYDAEEGRWRLLNYEKRRVMAQRYAMNLGILVAAAAFRASCAIQHVAVCARPFQTVDGNSSDLLGLILSQGDETTSNRFACCYTVELSRQAFCENDAYLRAVQGDPRQFFEENNANFETSQPADVFDFTEGLVSDALRRELTGAVDRPLSVESQVLLNCRSTRDLGINYRADLRVEAEKLADRLFESPDLTEAIRVVRELQNDSNDVSVFSACTRLMTALVEELVGVDDKNGVVDFFMGEDPHVSALERSEQLEQQDDKAGAAAVLKKEVDEALAAGVFADDDTVVRRVFDTSIARTLYNALRVGALAIPGIDLSAEADKRVELASDGLFCCALNASRLMESSFGGTDDALRYGLLSIKLAPTMVQGYMQTARLYTLMGDAEAARGLLLTALRLSVSQPVLSTIYYQLGYVEWKMGNLNSAMACYLKSIAMSPQVRLQAIGELRMLITEEHVELLDRSRIDDSLSEAGIPLVPSGEVVDVLMKAAEGAVNENLFPVARTLLVAALAERPDDVRGRILDSLG